MSWEPEPETLASIQAQGIRLPTSVYYCGCECGQCCRPFVHDIRERGVSVMPFVYNSRGDTFVEYVPAEPVCGRDFCDNCGDCIYCYAEDCSSNDYCGGPFWVLYEGSDDELIAELRAASTPENAENHDPR